MKPLYELLEYDDSYYLKTTIYDDNLYHKKLIVIRHLFGDKEIITNLNTTYLDDFIKSIQKYKLIRKIEKYSYQRLISQIVHYNFDSVPVIKIIHQCITDQNIQIIEK